jgi:hypothetical protein
LIASRSGGQNDQANRKKVYDALRELTEKKTESNSPLLQRVKRSNFIRAAALEWMRTNQPDVMAQIKAEAERQYPFTTERPPDELAHSLEVRFFPAKRQ